MRYRSYGTAYVCLRRELYRIWYGAKLLCKYIAKDIEIAMCGKFMKDSKGRNYMEKVVRYIILVVFVREVLSFFNFQVFVGTRSKRMIIRRWKMEQINFFSFRFHFIKIDFPKVYTQISLSPSYRTFSLASFYANFNCL